MTTGLYRVYWRLNPDYEPNHDIPRRPDAFKWEFAAGFVDVDDAVPWVRGELNRYEQPLFEFKVKHNNKIIPFTSCT
jgi:hypothetical protein